MAIKMTKTVLKRAERLELQQKPLDAGTLKDGVAIGDEVLDEDDFMVLSSVKRTGDTQKMSHRKARETW